MKYLIDYLFGGDISAFAAAIDCSAPYLFTVLQERGVVPVSLLVRIVTKLDVTPDWMLLGNKPLKQCKAFEEISEKVVSRQPLFNPAAMSPAPPGRVMVPCSRISGSTINTLAKAIYAARVADAPVIFLFDHLALKADGRAALLDLLGYGFATAFATTTATLYRDFTPSQNRRHEVIRRATLFAARTGVGLGEGVTRWARANVVSNRSLFVVADRHNVPITVHAQFGDAADYFGAYASSGRFGAELGAASYTDLLIFTEQVRRFVTTEKSVCVNATKNQAMESLLLNAIAAAYRTTKKRHGCVYKIDKQLLPFVVERCQKVFEGYYSANSGKICG